MILSMLAATISSRSAFSSSLKDGFTKNSPSILATLHSEIGPLNGMSETAIAADAARAANASGASFLSPEIS